MKLGRLPLWLLHQYFFRVGLILEKNVAAPFLFFLEVNLVTVKAVVDNVFPVVERSLQLDIKVMDTDHHIYDVFQL